MEDVVRWGEVAVIGDGRGVWASVKDSRSDF